MLNSFLNLQEDLEQENGHFSVLVQRKSGILSVKIVHKVNGTKWQKRWWWHSQKGNTQSSDPRVHCPEECLRAKVVVFTEQVGVRLRVHQDGEVEEDGEGQVEVEREEGEVKERRSCMKMGWSEDSRTTWAMRCMWHQGVTTKQRAPRAVLTGCATCACRCSCHSCWCSLCHACTHRSCWYSCCIRTFFVAIFL